VTRRSADRSTVSGPSRPTSRLADGVWLAARDAVRSLRRSPGFALTAIATLTLGIAASTALFSVMSGVLLRPLPYRDPARLVVVHAEQDFEGAAKPVPVRLPEDALARWSGMSTTIERLGLYSEGAAALDASATSELIDTAVVSSGFFETLDGAIVVGRPLGPADDGLPTVVVSERLWRRLFPDAGTVDGRSITLNRQPMAIVGVAGRSFQIPRAATDVWLTAGYARTRNPSCCSFLPIARLRTGATPADAAGEIDGIAHALAVERPRALGGVRVRVIGLRDALVGDARTPVLLLAGTAGLLLLLACANVANLMLARNAARVRDAAVRRALGASRGRLRLQAFVESGLLVGAAVVAGAGLAGMAVRVLAAWPVEVLPRLAQVDVDSPALLLACGTALACTWAAGLLAVRWPAAGVSIRAAREASAGPRTRTTLRVVAVAQLAISMVLLVGAVLLVRSLIALLRTDLGVTTERVATASLDLAMGRSLTDEQQIELVDRLLTRVSSLPGVVAAGIGTARPPDASRVRLTLNRTDDPGARASFQAAGVPATPGYFEALGIRLERGRFFTAADRAGAPPVVVMSAGTARLLFGAEDPVGRAIDLPVVRNGVQDRERMTVVGIVADVKYAGLDRVADAVVYRPFAQQAWRSVFLVVRTAAAPDIVAAQLQREIGGVDRAITVAEVTTMDALLGAATSQPRFRTLMLVSIAALATVIAAVGLCGLIAYTVSQRGTELGIRMALGADAAHIRRLVLREGLLLALAGAVLGASAAYPVSRVLSTLLFGIESGDPLTLVAAASALTAVGLLAGAVPAARAARLDPLAALRSDG
jgi:predicted permease